jgi:hypothetical protein
VITLARAVAWMRGQGRRIAAFSFDMKNSRGKLTRGGDARPSRLE